MLPTDTSLDFIAIITGLGGGLALFLYGMRKMTDALKTVAGVHLKDILAKLTTNRFTGALSGALITAVLQSSSVTTVMAVSFVSAGLMTFTQSVSVIMGANVGTTITAQIIAFKITKFSLVMIAGGFILEILAKTQRVRYSGMALMGLGLLFFGMELMSNAALPLRDYAPFVDIMREMRNPLMGVLAGFVFTALVQSSSATTGIVIVLASQGLISLEAGIALIFGANIGTCVTASLAAIGKPREAIKAAAVHVVFNVAGVFLWIWFIPYFADLVRAISPIAPGLGDIDRLAADVPRQIANAHTLFNVGNTVLFISFAGSLAAFVERLVPKPKALPPGAGAPVYLNEMYLDQPALALDQAKLELGRLAGLACGMTDSALDAALAGGDDDLNDLRDSDDDVDALHGEIITYLGKLSFEDIVEPLPHRIQEYIGVANYIENVGDTVETGFVSVGYKRLEMGVQFAASTRHLLEKIAAASVPELHRAVDAFATENLESAAAVHDSKDAFNALADEARVQLAHNLGKDPKAGLGEYRLAIELVESFKRIHTLARRISKTFLDFHQQDAPPVDPTPVAENKE